MEKPLSHRFPPIREREEQVFLLLTIVIGVLTGLAVVGFILLTERLGMRLYPVGSAAWRRMLIPILGSLGMGYLLFRYFPDARGSGVPQPKLPCLLVTGGNHGRHRPGNSSALRPLLPAASRSEEKGRRYSEGWHRFDARSIFRTQL